MRNLAPLLLVCLAGPIAAQRVTVSILATNRPAREHLPGRLFPGSTRAAWTCHALHADRQARADNPNSLLIDCGDTIQGTPLEYVYQDFLRTGKMPLGAPDPAALRGDPTILAMNHIGYDALVLGNHDFNYGLKALGAARRDSRVSVAFGPTPRWSRASSEAAFAPYLIKTVAGVRVAIVGVTTTGIPNWERPENYRGYRFHPAVEGGPARGRAVAGQGRFHRRRSARRTRAGRRGRLGGGREHGARDRQGRRRHPGGNLRAFASAGTRAPGGQRPSRPAQELGHLARARGFHAREDSGAASPSWKRPAASSRSGTRPWRTRKFWLWPSPYHEAAERHLDTAVASAPEPLDAALGRVEDNAPARRDPRGPVALLPGRRFFRVDLQRPGEGAARPGHSPADCARFISTTTNSTRSRATDKWSRTRSKNAARCFMTCRGGDCSQGPLLNSRVAGYNCDTAEGVEYEVDLSQPEGSRIRNLRWKGRPLEPSQKLRIAANNYRGRRQRRIYDVPGRTGGVAVRRGYPATHHRLLHGPQAASRTGRRKLAHRAAGRGGKAARGKRKP